MAPIEARGLPNIVRHVVTVLQNYENNHYLVQSINNVVFQARTLNLTDTQELLHYYPGQLVTADVFMEGKIIKDALIQPLISISRDEPTNNTFRPNLTTQIMKSTLLNDNQNVRCDDNVAEGEKCKKIEKKTHFPTQKCINEGFGDFGWRNFQKTFPVPNQSPSIEDVKLQLIDDANVAPITPYEPFRQLHDYQQNIDYHQQVDYDVRRPIGILPNNFCDSNDENFNNTEDLSFVSEDFNSNVACASNEATSSPKEDDNGNYGFEPQLFHPSYERFLQPVKLNDYFSVSPNLSIENGENYEDLNKNVNNNSSTEKFDSSNSHQSYTFVSDNSEFEELPELNEYK